MLRRDARLFLRGFIPALCLSLLLFALAGLAAYGLSRQSREGAPPVPVAVVDEEGGLVSRFVLNFVSSQDAIVSLMSMERVSRSAALKGFDEGIYEAVLLLPDGYTDAIRHGKPGEASLLLSKGAAASGDLLAALTRAGERLLSAGQNGVFAGEALAREADLSGEAYDHFIAESNQLLLNLSFSITDSGLKTTLTPYSGTGLDTTAYTALIWMSFFLLLSGLFFIPLYSRDNEPALLGRLQSAGLGAGAYLLGKVLYPFLFRILLFLPLLFGLSHFLPVTIGIGSLLAAMAGLLLASVYISAGAVALSSRRGWPGLMLALLCLCLFACGGLLPRALLPEWLRILGDYSPLGALAHLFKPLLGAPFAPGPVAAALGYGVILAWLAVRHYHHMPRGGAES